MRALRSIAVVTLVAAAAGASAGTYTVRRGDTLSGVAARHRLSVAALAEANGIGDHDRLLAGHRLVIPGGGGGAAAPAPRSRTEPAVGTVHVVRAGDSLDRLARRYGTTVADLVRRNGIADPNRVRIGTRLMVPGGMPAGASSADAPRSLPSRLRASPERLALRPRFAHWSREYGVPADLLEAMTWMESGWQNHVVSSTGARGIGQLMPDTVAFVSQVLLRTRLDPGRPDDNIRMSARYLRWLLDRHGGRADRALAAYYQGFRSVAERGLLPETRLYVDAVQALRPRFG